MQPNRRDVLKATGVAGATALAAGPASARTVDHAFEADAGPQAALVVFRRPEQVTRLDDLGVEFHAYEVLPIGYASLTPEQIATVADWPEVRRVKRSEELEYYNDDAREALKVNAVQSEYKGEGVDVVVIDSGIDGSHPDFSGRIESNWQYVDDPLGPHEETWVDVGAADSDEVGHGQHCSGILAGDGAASEGQYRGMAPKARLSVYSTTQGIYLPYALGAWDHMLARADDPDVGFDPKVVSNSYGVARGSQYNPNDPLNVATWEAYERGILAVFAAGNDGPGTNTLNRYAKAPHVLGVAATNDDKQVTEFSSRGREFTTDDGSQPVRYDREELLTNLVKFQHAMESGQVVVDDGSYEGELGPGTTEVVLGTGAGASTGGDTYTWEAPPNADLFSFTLSLTPDAQQITVSIYRVENGDRTLVARMGEEPVYIHRSLATDVEGGATYEIDVEPTNNVAVQYEIDWLALEKHERGPDDLADLRPVTLSRPGVATPGNSIMSTLDPQDALAPLSTDSEPFYGKLSGTSMACPAAAGIATLAIEAYRESHNDRDPTPIELIRALETTADDSPSNTEYTPYSAGAGFVDAKAAIEYVESLDSSKARTQGAGGAVTGQTNGSGAGLRR